MQRPNGFCGKHDSSVRNPCDRLQHHTQMTADFFRATLTVSSRKTARRKVIMAKKKSKQKRAVGKAKHTGVGKKVVKKKKRPAKTASKAKKVAKKVAKKATKPVRKKAKAHPKPAIAAKKVAKKKVVKPKSAAPLPAPPVLEPPPVEHASTSEPAPPTDAEASAS